MLVNESSFAPSLVNLYYDYPNPAAVDRSAMGRQRSIDRFA